MAPQLKRGPLGGPITHDRQLPPDIAHQIEQGLASADPKAKLHAGILLQRLIVHEGPERAWPLVARWGTVEDADTRKTIADWALSPLLDRQFDHYFPLAEQLAMQNPRFGELLLASFDLVDGFARAERIDAVRRRLLDSGLKPWPALPDPPSLDSILSEKDPDVFADGLRDHLLGREEPSKAEGTALRVLMLCLDVPNGGFRQFFWNSAGNEAQGTIAALRQLGAGTHARLLQQASSAFGDSGPAIDIHERRNQIEALGEPAGRTWRALDEAYYKADDLIVLLHEFVRTHRGEFRD